MGGGSFDIRHSLGMSKSPIAKWLAARMIPDSLAPTDPKTGKVVTRPWSSGDEVQMLKAGLMEIGNIFAINKADRPGANKLMITLQNFLETLSKDKDDWSPQAVHTVATEGKGTDELVSSIDSHRSFNEKQGIHKQKMEERYTQRITKLITDVYVERFWDDTNCLKLQRELKKNHHDRTSPYDLAKQMLSK